MDLKYIERIVAHAEDAVNALDHGRHARVVLAGRCTPHALASWYVNACEGIRYSANLLQDASEALWEEGTAPGLARLLAQKVDEERNHHLWCIRDLDVLGFDREWRQHVVPAPAVKAYLAFNRSLCVWRPAAFAGTAFVLEYMAIHRARRTAENLIKHSKVQDIENAVSFLTGHADADESHVKSMLDCLKDNAVDDDTAEAICAAAMMTRLYYPGFFEPVRLTPRRDT